MDYVANSDASYSGKNDSSIRVYSDARLTRTFRFSTVLYNLAIGDSA